MFQKIKGKLNNWLKHPNIENTDISTTKVESEKITEEQGKYDGYNTMVKIIKDDLYKEDLNKKKKKAISINQIPLIKYNLGVGSNV